MSRLFLQAVSLPEEQRSAFLEQHRNSDPSMCNEIFEMLEAESSGSNGLDTGTFIPQQTTSEPPPKRIGSFDVLEELGRGGMGVVYRGAQTTPISREVAIKLIRSVSAPAEVWDRFHAERQTLATLDHPNITRVIDAGTTEQGRPYVVMEYVRGESINEYCDSRKLPLNERIELFLQLCSGIQHAHGHAVIHRDVKPSNVLVTEVDGRPTVKIIDFGIARGPGVHGHAPASGSWLDMAGTPGYMSPGWIAGPSRGDDARSDVFALGVMLAELTAGLSSFKPLNTEMGLTASTLLERGGSSADAVADRRRIKRRRLVTRVRGDLDAIIAKATQPEAAERYQSVDALGADVRRYLAHEPVSARPTDALYVLRKFSRRHAAVVTVSLVALVALLGFATVMTVQAVRLNAAKAREASSAQSARDVTTALLDLLSTPTPPTRNVFVPTQQALDAGLDRMEATLESHPQLRSSVFAAVGVFKVNTGETNAAERFLLQAVEELEAQLGPTHTKTRDAMWQLARVRIQQKRYTEAEALLQDVLSHAPDGEPPRIEPLRDLGMTYKSAGRYPEAAATFRLALDAATNQLGVDHPETLFVQSLLAASHIDRKDYASAEALLRPLVQAMVRTNHPELMYVQYNLAAALCATGQIDEGLDHLYDALLSGFLYLDFRPDPAFAAIANDPRFHRLYRVAWLLRKDTRVEFRSMMDEKVRQGDHVTAERLLRETHQEFRRSYGSTDWRISSTETELARVLLLQGQIDEASTMIDSAYRARADGPVRQNTVFLGRMEMLRSQIEIAKGRPEASLAAAQRASELFLEQSFWGERSPDHLFAQASMASLRGDEAEALRLLEQAIALGLTLRSWIGFERTMQGLADDPRYLELRQRAEQRFPFR